MDTYRQVIENDGIKIPCIMIEPSNPVGAAVIIHGYGGCKEEQFGLAWRVAEIGIATCAIDLRGHGQNEVPLDEKALSDIDVITNYCRCFGKVVTIGHSLGGRLSLISGADYAIGISPALGATFGNQTRENLRNLRKYKVRDWNSEDFLDIFKNLPVWQPSKERPSLLIYGTRDIPEIILECNKFTEKNVPVTVIEEALHNDIYLNEITFETISNQLREWFK